MQSNYSVQIEKFAESHFIKSFAKKYKNHWETTLIGITTRLERIDALINTSRAETICDLGGIKIIKMEFRVDHTKESARTSGNRCIAAWHVNQRVVRILLVYAKTDLHGKNETDEWKGIIRNNYSEFRFIR